MYASLQFCGNIEEYFYKNTEKLLVYIVMPRLKNEFNLLRVYEKGDLIQEKKVLSSSNIFLYYFLWYLGQIFFMLKYFSHKEEVVLIGGHPISFLGMFIQRLFRKITFVYFVGDYFPSTTITLSFFEKLKKFYHERMEYAVYLSDRINNKMNGKTMNTYNKKTVMWGVKPKNVERSLPKDFCSLLFVGLIKESQGLEFLLRFLKDHGKYRLSIIGICEDQLFRQFQKTITKYSLNNRVFFPNKFFTDLELDNFSKTCHIGIALYDTSRKSSTYYTDPGKVKAYAEMGLPIIMSNTSAIAAYIKKFNAGKIVRIEKESLRKAIIEISDNYQLYKKGVKSFNNFFSYERYYQKSFSFLESIWL